MKGRHPDGKYRGRSPTKVSETTLRARWVESEVLRLKRLGLSFEAIAEQITLIGRGQSQAMSPTQEGVMFPPDYRISSMACCKAFHRALDREPNLEAEAMRRLDTDRCEEIFLNLQPSIRKGNPRAAAVAITVLAHKASINRYSRSAIELTGKDGAPLIPMDALSDLLEQADREKP
jgi:hypothetical protein